MAAGNRAGPRSRPITIKHGPAGARCNGDLHSPPVYVSSALQAAFNMAATRLSPKSGEVTFYNGDEPSMVNGERGDGSRVPEVGSKPFLIGVAGGTASGKSTVCQKIVESLGQKGRVDIISQECFYRKLNEQETQLAEKGLFDFDHPGAFDDKLMMETLNDIIAGKTVTVQEYDFKNNCRSEKKKRVIEPADVILLEGILVFYFTEVRKLFSMKLFVDTDADTRLSRRVLRDMQDRGRSLDHILTQYTTFVKPAFEEFCLPTKKYADIIIPRGADNTVAIDLIVQHIHDLLSQVKTPVSRSAVQATLSSASLHSNDSLSSLRQSSVSDDVEFKYTSAH